MNIENIFQKALSYKDYRKQIDELVAEGKTTGLTQTEALLGFTKLNIQRMNRLDKTIEIEKSNQNKIQKISHNYLWLLIGDAWCGDCAQIIPIINKMVELSDSRIYFRIISRDTFPELIDAYQSNGTKSIPKLLVIDANNYEVLKTWGPRPKGAHEVLLHWKENLDTMTKEDFERDLHLWYARDKGISIQREIAGLI